jgi:RNA polymerase sigma-54 factor
MALSARLQFRQTQSLVITPQLMQAIRLLQMSRTELECFLAAEMEANPLLRDGGEAEAAEASEVDPSNDGRGAPQDQADRAGFQERAPAPGPGHPTAASASGTRSGIAPDIPAQESLPALLERRIDGAFARAPQDRLIALALLSALDEAGYLTVPIDTVAARLSAPVAAVECVLARCQDLAPTGVFARSLAECLALQLKERNRLDPAMEALLAHLDLLAARDRSGLCRVCGVDRHDLDDMIAEIRALDPKPGLAFASEAAPTLVPDVLVRGKPGGGWVVELNGEAMPRLLIDRPYYAELAKGCARDGDRRFLADCLQKASWLEKSLDQRARTVLNVASEIVRCQEGFLTDGVAYLKPMNLRTVADALGIHESTVSRAGANKTISTPRGIFEFRYFFTSAIPASSGGEPHSAAAVKHRIRKLIGDERPDAILSDDTLVALLAKEGVEIARRTVAKYREGMGIGSSVERRREKRLAAAS